jgi:G3E family GTPase
LLIAPILQDIVILNKIDLISAVKETTELEDLKMKIHGINSLATIVCTTRCQVDLDKLLNRESYGGEVSNYIELAIFVFLRLTNAQSVCALSL